MFKIIPVNASYITFKYLDNKYDHFMRTIETHFVFEQETFTKSFPVRLYNKKYNILPYGLLDRLIKLCERHNIDYAVSKKFLLDYQPNQSNNIDSYIPSINLGMVPYSYQLDAFKHVMTNRRSTILSATSSGKSLIIYLMSRYFIECLSGSNLKLVIVVPSVSLVNQIYSDFKDYSNDDQKFMSLCLMNHGSTKEMEQDHHRIIIATFQTLVKHEEPYFEQFGMIIGDECHRFIAKSLNYIGKNCINAYYRCGLTGTLSPKNLHMHQIVSHFGEVKEIINPFELQQQGKATQTKVNILRLGYDKQELKILAKEYISFKKDYRKRYEHLLNFIMNHDKRNRFIVDMCVQLLEGNSLLLFNRIEHLIRIKDMLVSRLGERSDKKVFVINGTISDTKRSEMKDYTESNKNVIILATYGTMSTGVSIKNLNNLVFCHPLKSSINIRQSIGRVMRLHEDKDIANIYDLVDDLRVGIKTNALWKQGIERLEIYHKDKHDCTIEEINL